MILPARTGGDSSALAPLFGRQTRTTGFPAATLGRGGRDEGSITVRTGDATFGLLGHLPTSDGTPARARQPVLVVIGPFVIRGDLLPQPDGAAVFRETPTAGGHLLIHHDSLPRFGLRRDRTRQSTQAKSVCRPHPQRSQRAGDDLPAEAGEGCRVVRSPDDRAGGGSACDLVGAVS